MICPERPVMVLGNTSRADVYGKVGEKLTIIKSNLNSNLRSCTHMFLKIRLVDGVGFDELNINHSVAEFSNLIGQEMFSNRQ